MQVNRNVIRIRLLFSDVGVVLGEKLCLNCGATMRFYFLPLRGYSNSYQTFSPWSVNEKSMLRKKKGREKKEESGSTVIFRCEISADILRFETSPLTRYPFHPPFEQFFFTLNKLDPSLS